MGSHSSVCNFVAGKGGLDWYLVRVVVGREMGLLGGFCGGRIGI